MLTLYLDMSMLSARSCRQESDKHNWTRITHITYLLLQVHKCIKFSPNKRLILRLYMRKNLQWHLFKSLQARHIYIYYKPFCECVLYYKLCHLLNCIIIQMSECKYYSTLYICWCKQYSVLLCKQWPWYDLSWPTLTYHDLPWYDLSFLLCKHTQTNGTTLS